MSTISHYKEVDINKKNPLLSQIRTTVETAFYGNNFERVTDISKAYYLAKNCPSTMEKLLEEQQLHDILLGI